MLDNIILIQNNIYLIIVIHIPIYTKNNTIIHTFSGKRIYRGLYKTKNGIIFNADVNGALNIIRKSNFINLIETNIKYLQQTKRIQVA